DGAFLMDRFGPGFTLLLFGEGSASKGLEASKKLLSDERIAVITLPPGGGAARVYGAGDGDAVLVRPDRFIAARWHNAHPAEIIAAVDIICRGGTPQGKRSAA
ncbi:MAG: hypothetical protein ACON31_06955, partial [Candidatus Puniceispirillaceae bacterium]